MNEIVRGMPFAEYLAAPGAHATALWRIVSQSPAHYRYAEDHPEESTEAMVLGSALHCRVLEPDEFDRRYAIEPMAWDRRSREGKSAAAEFAHLEGDKTILRYDDGERLRAMAEQVLYHDAARGLLELPAENELSLFWDVQWVACKGRLDRLISGRQIVDLKSCQNAKRGPFERTCAERGHFMQMAFYRDGLREIQPTPPPPLPILIAVEKEPPYAVAVHQMSEAAWQHGVEQYLKALRRLAACERTGRWPGYEGISELNPPKWAKNETIFE